MALVPISANELVSSVRAKMNALIGKANAIGEAVEATAADAIQTAADREATETAAAIAVAAQGATTLAAAAVGVYSAATLLAAIALGISDVADGDPFYATGADVTFTGLYRRDGSAATEIARTAKVTAIQASDALAGHFAGIDHGLYPTWGDGILSPTDRGFWFDATDPRALFSDLAGTIPAVAGDPVKYIRPHRSVANPDINSVTDRTLMTGFTATGVTAGTATGSDGVSTVRLLTETTANAAHYYRHSSITPVALRRYVIRSRVKLTNRIRCSLAAGSIVAVFDVSTESVVSVSTNTEASVRPASNGFYDIALAWVAPNAVGFSPQVALAAADGSLSYAGSASATMAVEYFDVLSASYDGFVQADGTKAPALADTTVGTILDPDGSNDAMIMSAFDLTGASKVTMVVAGVQDAATTSPKIAVEHGYAPTGGYGVMTDRSTPAGNITPFVQTSGSDYTFCSSQVRAAGSPFCLIVEFDPEQATPADRVRAWLDGDEISWPTISAIGTMTAANAFASRPLYLFARLGSSLFSDLKIAGILIVDRDLIAAERERLTRTGKYRSGQPAVEGGVFPCRAFSDAGEVVQQSWGMQPGAYARVEIETEATAMTVSHYNNISGTTYTGFSQIGVTVDGAWQQDITPAGLGAGSSMITLPDGPKLVSFVAGLQTKRPGEDIIGSWVTKVKANAPMQQVFRSSTKVLIYGDSIGVGANASPVQRYGWPMRLRAALHPVQVAVEGYGWRSLYEDAVDDAAKKAFVRKILAHRPDILWMAIGTNDYFLAQWNAATFGAAYADILDRLHAALPGLRIYAQTPLSRAVEATNAAGSTTGAYRSAIATACTGKSWVTLIDGTAIMTTASLADGVHPTTAGHGIYADYVKGVLGW
ncbi:lysophospholipase L1-like esterase [Ancylobacter aquaticus]|uniref:Lysophospholipase L1-like esterase n=1 Tax=Ancylobacter aquaticus TaxID=100 RepID=A0A4R1I2M4_ANCAQ|nr:SGNH/GDSL hydrolase family protein [Ancylobacter aquaticus]TCK28183.1 lysophospholipase L1-like esterase [Ancylobacter aquaticus]